MKNQLIFPGNNLVFTRNKHLQKGKYSVYGQIKDYKLIFGTLLHMWILVDFPSWWKIRDFQIMPIILYIILYLKFHFE